MNGDPQLNERELGEIYDRVAKLGLQDGTAEFDEAFASAADNDQRAKSASMRGGLKTSASDVLGGFFGTLEGLGNAVRHPIDTLSGMVSSQVGQFGKAKQAFDEGRYSEAAGHGAAGILPVIGPAAASTGERLGSGDIGGAAGELLAGLMIPPVAKGVRAIAPDIASGVASGARAAGGGAANLVRRGVDVATEKTGRWAKNSETVTPFKSEFVAKPAAAVMDTISDFLKPESPVDRFKPNTSGYKPGGSFGAPASKIEPSIDHSFSVKQRSPDTPASLAGLRDQLSKQIREEHPAPYGEGAVMPLGMVPTELLDDVAEGYTAPASTGPPSRVSLDTRPDYIKGLDRDIAELAVDRRERGLVQNPDTPSFRAMEAARSGELPPSIQALGPERQIPGIGETSETAKVGSTANMLADERTIDLVRMLDPRVKSLKQIPKPSGSTPIARAIRQRGHIHDKRLAKQSAE